MAANTFVKIPFEAAKSRELAKQLGAHWRRDVGEWSVPTPHVRAVRQSIAEETGARRPARQFSMEGRTTVKIPFEASEARALAKRLGARWMAVEKLWALPEEHYSTIRQAIERDPGMAGICVGEPCNCGGMQIWEGACLRTGRSLD